MTVAWLRLYRAASRPVRGQFWMTLCAVVFFTAATASGQTMAPVAHGETWFTFQNLVTAAILIYGVGMNVQNFRDVGRRLEALERDFKEFRETTIPETYLRKDIFAERMGRRESDPVILRKTTP